MSLRKKIILSFFISVFIIGILTTLVYVNFIELKNEISFLEVTDSARNRSLSILRHEKNFFLFPETASAESRQMMDYLAQLEDLIPDIQARNPAQAENLKTLIGKYRSEFGEVETLLAQISQENQSLTANPATAGLGPLLDSESRNSPSRAADYLQGTLSLPATNPEVVALRQLDQEVGQLRETGEGLQNTVNGLDKDIRGNATRVISISQIAILVVFPLFLLIGLSALLNVSNDLVKKLKKLTGAVEKSSARYKGKSLPINQSHKDEIDILSDKILSMNKQSLDWEKELERKNQETLVQAKKLAAIGTLASGVAHELNNPLNNISITAQVLKKKIGSDQPPEVAGMVKDIVGQTDRVKDIVADLLEFAREREPRLQQVDVAALAEKSYELVAKTAATGSIAFRVDSGGQDTKIMADPDQLERVFVNLFSNGIAAIEGNGNISVRTRPRGVNMEILVSDTGKGIPAKDRDKIFDPFFTNKDRGNGLGLAIVMNTVQKHGGRISVISEEGEGTIFEIILPKAGKPE